MVDAERDTALVTGASGGLGAEFAKLFAAQGCDLVLASRDGEALRRLATTLAGAHRIRVEILPLDLSRAEAPARLFAFVEEKGLKVDALVNNAGYGTFGAFAENDLEAELGQIQVNVTALTHLARLVLPGMIRRGRGRILNVASTAAFQPGPLMAVYYATKAYVLSLSLALANELKGSGVTVSCLCPGPTRTNFMVRAKIGDPETLAKKSVMMDPAVVARQGYNGLMKGKRLIIPGTLNKVLAQSTRLASRGLSASVVRRILDEVRSTAKPRPT